MLDLDPSCHRTSMSPQIFDIPSGATIQSIVFSTAILALTMDLAETGLYAAGEDGMVYQLDLLATREAFADPQGGAFRTFAGHEGPVTALACSFDGTLLLSTSSDSTAKVCRRDPSPPARIRILTRRWPHPHGPRYGTPEAARM